MNEWISFIVDEMCFDPASEISTVSGVPIIEMSSGHSTGIADDVEWVSVKMEVMILLSETVLRDNSINHLACQE